jgi:hypothetical protein
MKKLLFGSILLGLLSVYPVTTLAEVNVSVGISVPLPPLIVFEAPPTVVVLPETNSVYVVPYIEADLFFWNGWWWRPWQGRWYRSHYYNRGWGYYNRVPSFYYDVEPNWRVHYRDHNWNGHRWQYEQIPHQRLQQNWKGWQSNRYWEKKKTWDVQDYQPRPQQQKQELRQQRQVQYQQRPEVQQHQQMQQQQKQQAQKQQKSQVQQPQKQQPQVQQKYQPGSEMERQQQQRQTQEQQKVEKQKKEQQAQPQKQQPQKKQPQKQQQHQPQDQQHQKESQDQQSQGKPEKGDSEHRK